MRTIILFSFIFSVQAIMSQFSVGYGLGYFPSGMSSLYTEQDFFLKSGYAELINGPVTKSKKLLPFHHGFNVSLITGAKKNNPLNFQLSFINLGNSLHCERTNLTDNSITTYRKKSRLNSFLFGPNFRLNTKSLSSFSFLGVFSNHTTFHDNNGSWEKDSKGEFDIGVDIGLNFNFGQSIGMYLHYTKCFAMYSSYNPSYLGVNLNYHLTKRKKKK